MLRGAHHQILIGACAKKKGLLLDVGLLCAKGKDGLLFWPFALRLIGSLFNLPYWVKLGSTMDHLQLESELMWVTM